MRLSDVHRTSYVLWILAQEFELGFNGAVHKIDCN